MYTADNANSCSDGNVCNGTESCSAGTCVPGTALTCNDNKPCTDDSCNPATGCVYANDNTNTCSDGNACTTADTCVNGACVGGPAPTCNDNNPCTDDSCSAATGCVYTADNANPCADANACNGVEVCFYGACLGGSPPTCNDNNPCTDDTCSPATGCVYTNDDTNSCGDGNACNGAETCSAGACVPGTALTCNDSNPCTDDTCNTATGCVNASDDTNTCEDGLFCTSADHCVGGACTGNPSCPGLLCDEVNDYCVNCLSGAECNDGNPCTNDRCISGFCSYVNNTSPCDDGRYCTATDACSGGACAGSGTPCSGQVCDEANDRCVGCLLDTHCDDDTYCNGRETCDIASGTCRSGTPVDCFAQDPSRPLCDEARDRCAQCLENERCLYGQYCNGDETCNLTTGSCIAGTMVDCSQLDPTRPYCDEGTDACVQCLAPGDCNDDNSCTDEACVGGACQHLVNTAPCNDGLFCTATDTCSNGVCQGAGDRCPGAICNESLDSCANCLVDLDCNDSNACTNETCVNYVCVYVMNNDECEDEQFCTYNDHCDQGICTGQPSCAGYGLLCDEAGDVCVGCLSATDCDDSKVCTRDRCQGGFCSYVPVSELCSDGLFCTLNDACANGDCVGTGTPCPGQVCDEASGQCLSCSSSADCDDGNLCTDDACTGGACVNTNNTAPCDDGRFCTAVDACANGACVGAGDPCAGLAQCDEATDSCGGCLPPVAAEAAGGRFLSITPANLGSAPFAILIEGAAGESAVACVSTYVQRVCAGGLNNLGTCVTNADCPKACDGGLRSGLACSVDTECTPPNAGFRCVGACTGSALGGTPVYRVASDWGVVYVSGEDIRPSSSYSIHTVCDTGAGPFPSAGISVQTWLWGDADDNDAVNVLDISGAVDIIKRVPTATTLHGANIWGCNTDQAVNVLDVASFVDAVKSRPYPCPAICP